MLPESLNCSFARRSSDNYNEIVRLLLALVSYRVVLCRGRIRAWWRFKAALTVPLRLHRSGWLSYGRYGGNMKLSIETENGVEEYEFETVASGVEAEAMALSLIHI